MKPVAGEAHCRASAVLAAFAAVAKLALPALAKQPGPRRPASGVRQRSRCPMASTDRACSLRSQPLLSSRFLRSLSNPALGILPRAFVSAADARWHRLTALTHPLG
ncbi:hypothetical protein GCM10009105_18810 [Dokdonella soli]|uniref:Uncharacterized protein n=1 Tax=Dokdonella soli TaxID=529810 RepID=A0ABN1IIA2_9GAMM